MANKNTRYKVRISESPIFWTINSINHPSSTLWENTYLPTFIDIECYVNWVDVFTVTSVLDKSTYTMLELTDTVTNEVMYFLNSKINKKLSSGYEMEFKVDVYLTFGLKFYAWMVDNKLPIHLNRFLNNDVLKEWFKQSKFINQDPLLNYKKGVVKIDNTSPKISGSLQQIVADFKNGENLDAINYDNINNITSTNGFSDVLWVVVEDNNSNYYAIMTNSNSSTKGTTTLTLSTSTIDVDTTFEDVMSIATSNYWIDKFVGIFIIPCWWFINTFCKLTDGNNNYLSFIINRSGWMKLKTYSQQILNPTYFSLNTSQFTTEDPNHPNSNTFVDYINGIYVNDDNHDFENFKLYYNPKADDLVVNDANNDTSNQYIVNSYFFSQLRRENSIVQFSPINGFWSMFDDSILTFDGNNFNLVNTFKNTINLIDVYNGTMNVATSGYDAYLAGVKTNMNTNLQVAKSQIDLQTQQNNANNIMSSISSGFNVLNSLSQMNFGGVVSGIMGIASSNVNTSFDNQKLQLQYTNLQKQQDAQLATARLTSSAKNISSTNAEDDSNIKILLSWYDTNKSLTNNSLATMSLAYFISNVNDLLFLHNLIYKNGLFCDMFITADVAFQDSTNLNDFIYLDLSFDDDYIRFFSPNLPSDYVDALKIVCNNSLRIWDKVMDVTNMPVYYIDFLNQARDAFVELYITNQNDVTPNTSLDISLGYPVGIDIDTLHQETFQNGGNSYTISYPKMASEYSNDETSWVSQVIKQCFPQFTPVLNIDESTIQVVNDDYYNSLDANTQSILNDLDLGSWNGKSLSLTQPDDYAGQVFYVVELDHTTFGGDETNRVITNQSLWWIQDNQYLIKINSAGKLLDMNNLIVDDSKNLDITVINYYYPNFINELNSHQSEEYNNFQWTGLTNQNNNYVFITPNSNTKWSDIKQYNANNTISLDYYDSINHITETVYWIGIDETYTSIDTSQLLTSIKNELYPNNSISSDKSLRIQIIDKYSITQNGNDYTLSSNNILFLSTYNSID